MGTQLARQPLGDDQVDCGGDVETGNAHVVQTDQGFGGAVGVQGGEHHVSGLGGLDGDFGSFQVADLAHHDHVRSEEHTSELQSLMRISYAVYCLKKKQKTNTRDKSA